MKIVICHIYRKIFLWKRCSKICANIPLIPLVEQLLVSGINHFREGIQFSIQFMRLCCLLKKPPKWNMALLELTYWKDKKIPAENFLYLLARKQNYCYFFWLSGTFSDWFFSIRMRRDSYLTIYPMSCLSLHETLASFPNLYSWLQNHNLCAGLDCPLRYL